MTDRLTPVGSRGGAEARFAGRGMLVQIVQDDIVGNVARGGREVAPRPANLASAPPREPTGVSRSVIQSGLSVIALVLIALSFRDTMYNKIFYLFSGSVLAFFLIAPWIYNNFMR